MTRDFDSLEKDACEHLSDAVNSSTFDNTKFCNWFNRTHRYLQYRIFTLIQSIIINCASDDYQYDDRNEWCHKVSKYIVENCKEFF